MSLRVLLLSVVAAAVLAPAAQAQVPTLTVDAGDRTVAATLGSTCLTERRPDGSFSTGCGDRPAGLPVTGRVTLVGDEEIVLTSNRPATSMGLTLDGPGGATSKLAPATADGGRTWRARLPEAVPCASRLRAFALYPNEAGSQDDAVFEAGARVDGCAEPGGTGLEVPVLRVGTDGDFVRSGDGYVNVDGIAARIGTPTGRRPEARAPLTAFEGTSRSSCGVRLEGLTALTKSRPHRQRNGTFRLFGAVIRPGRSGLRRNLITKGDGGDSGRRPNPPTRWFVADRTRDVVGGIAYLRVPADAGGGTLVAVLSGRPRTQRDGCRMASPVEVERAVRRGLASLNLVLTDVP